MKKVLVAGATGYLGKYVVKEFKKQGFWIRTLTRKSAKFENLKNYFDEEFIGEITDKNSLSGICDNIGIVFSSIGITKQKDGLTYMDVDYQANKNLLDEAKKSGVKKFIYISVFGADKMQHLKAIQAKLRFEDELRNSGLDYTIIYPNGFFSDMLEYLQMAKKGRGYVFGNGDNKINPIHGKDLAEVCVDAAVKNVKEIFVGGPDIFSHNEILSLAFETLNKNQKISKIPIWIKSLTLKLMRAFTSVKVYGPAEFFMTVLVEDMVAPKSGNYHLQEFFKENLKRE